MLKNLEKVNKVALALAFITVCAIVDDLPFILIKMAMEVVILIGLCVIFLVIDFLQKERKPKPSEINEQLDEVRERIRE
ncbi:MAG: hypothetical protein KBT03_07665 [Bacteroidales bacterium]|nr:hypothetical protein [Candidatus Scybalousia scybalohippi]